MFEKIKKILFGTVEVGENKNIQTTGEDIVMSSKMGGNYNDIFGEFFGLDNFYPQQGLSGYNQFFKGWVYSCISKISESMSSQSYSTFKSEKKTDDPDIKLITSDLLEGITSYYELYGTAFIKKEKIGNRVIGLKLLDTSKVTIQYKPGTFEIDLFYYIENGTQYKYDYKNDIIKISSFNPSLPYPFNHIGIGKIQALILQLTTDKETLDWNLAFFKNGVSLGSVLSTDKTLSKDQMQLIRNEFMSKYMGTKNGQKFAVLDNGFKYENLKVGQKELDFVAQREFTRDEILAIFGVPKALLGLGEGVNVGNVEAFKEIFLENTIIPLASKIENAFNTDSDLFKITVFKFVNINKEKQDSILMLYNSGVLTLNEVRGKLNLLPLKDGDNLNFQMMYGNFSTPTTDSKNTDTTKTIENIQIKGFDKIEKLMLEGYDITSEEYQEKKVEKDEQIVKLSLPQFESALLRVWNSQIKDMTKGGIESFEDLKQKINDYYTKGTDFQYSMYILPILQRNAGQFLASRENELKTLLLQQNDTVKISGLVKLGDKEMSKVLLSSIKRLGTSLDDTNKIMLLELIDKYQNLGLGVKEIVGRVKNEFGDINKGRLKTIVRTELLESGNEVISEYYKQNEDIVKYKKWYTSKDERTCKICGPLHGKKVGVSDNFFDKGGITPTGYPIDYRDIGEPPIHPNCRCTIIPEL